jgi:uncharacterized protein (UPF0262 family)
MTDPHIGGAELPEAEQEVKLQSLLVDDLTWRYATRPRRAEWIQAIDETIEEATLTAPTLSPLRAYVTIQPDAISVAFHDLRGVQIGRIDVPRLIIAPVFREYMTLLQAIGSQGAAGYSPQVEALDIARRLMHNDAAELLMRHSLGVRPSHKTARRLFTLFVLLTHDTTKLRAA